MKTSFLPGIGLQPEELHSIIRSDFSFGSISNEWGYAHFGINEDVIYYKENGSNSPERSSFLAFSIEDVDDRLVLTLSRLKETQNIPYNLCCHHVSMLVEFFLTKYSHLFNEIKIYK